MAAPSPAPDCWLHPDVAPGPSTIAGTGLFAGAPISGGTAVARVGGRLVTDAELQALIRQADGCLDCIAVDDGVNLVLPAGTPNHYGNHSCSPNLGWAGEYVLVALSDIVAGEELTSDYATSTTDPRFLLRCHCETYRCRQLITGDDWQIPQLQQRYAGQWSPPVQRLIDGAAVR